MSDFNPFRPAVFLKSLHNELLLDWVFGPGFFLFDLKYFLIGPVCVYILGLFMHTIFGRLNAAERVFRMLQISVSELKANAGKYVTMADEQDIYITKNGKRVAKITSAKADKVTAAKSLFGLLPSDIDLDKVREERLK